jgi:hypothetical protein
VLKHLDDYSDCARVSLASPRLGLAALQKRLPRFQHPLFAVAMRLLMVEAAVCELMPRSGTPAEKRAETSARVMSALCGAGSTFAEAWLRKYASDAAAIPMRNGLVDALVRTVFHAGQVWRVLYYEGEKGVEHAVRREMTDGTVQYLEGERGAEHVVPASNRLGLCTGQAGGRRGGRGTL